jgi:hypothetical protein
MKKSTDILSNILAVFLIITCVACLIMDIFITIIVIDEIKHPTKLTVAICKEFYDRKSPMPDGCWELIAKEK